jgi:hypothetical protein
VIISGWISRQVTPPSSLEEAIRQAKGMVYTPGPEPTSRTRMPGMTSARSNTCSGVLKSRARKGTPFLLETLLYGVDITTAVGGYRRPVLKVEGSISFGRLLRYLETACPLTSWPVALSM